MITTAPGKADPESSETSAVLDALLKGTGSRFWWAVTDREKIHDKLVPHVRWLQNNQAYRHINNLHYMRLYGNFEAVGLSVGTYARPKTARLERPAWNITKSCIDTVTAKIAKNRPKPTFVTEDGNPAYQKKAKYLDRFMQGQFYGLKLYHKGPNIFRDSCIFGTGISKVCEYGGKIHFERIFPDEIYVDDVEAVHGDPRNLFHVKPLAREIALATYAWDYEKNKIDEDKAEAIRRAPRADSQYVVADRNADVIEIYEGWHLPSHEKANDGVHAICCNGKTLFHEDYKRHRFPFSRLVWTPPVLGWYGSGLAEELNGTQLEVNFLLKRIQEAFRILGVPMIFIENGSKVDQTKFKNVVGNIYTYTTTPPTVATFQTIHPEIFQHLQSLVQKAYEISGVSQASAQAKNPLGPKASGEALRTWDDMESERFVLAGQRYEEWVLDVAELVLDEARGIAEKNGGHLKTVSMGKKYGRSFIEEIDFRDVNLPAEKYQMKVFPTSSLPQTPALKMQTISEMQDRGTIGQEDAVELMDMPDLDRVRSRITAGIDDIDETIEDFLEGKPYTAPEPFHLPLGQQALARFNAAYLRAKRQNYNDADLDKLRTWMTQFQNMLAPPAPPAPAIPASAGPPGPSLSPSLGLPPGAPPMLPPPAIGGAPPMPAPQAIPPQAPPPGMG